MNKELVAVFGLISLWWGTGTGRAATPELLNIPLTGPVQTSINGLARLVSVAAGETTTADAAAAFGQMATQMRGNSRAPRGIVGRIETAVAAAPASTLQFDDRGFATLAAAGGRWAAGRFRTPRLGALRAEAPIREPAADRGCRFFVLAGTSPLADIGALQAFDDGETVFQVASQYNCLEAPGPESLATIANYFNDPTQGPRASISAFPGTFLRHYRAPSTGSNERFVQVTDGAQVQLLGDTLPPTVARVQNGYLREQDVADHHQLASILTDRFDEIRIGVHDGVEVVRGFNWDGPVREPHPRVTQVFTSTLAGGSYSPRLTLDARWRTSIRQLLKASYLGTILAATNLGRRRVLLTLIGGGVFGNPPELIREAILQAMEEADRRGARLDIVLNVWDRSPDSYLSAVRARRGAIIQLSPTVILRR